MHKCIKENAPVRLTNELIMTADTHDCNKRASTHGVLQVLKPPQNLLETRLDIKGLHYRTVCHPISKMPRMLIISNASIKSELSSEHMSGTSNVCLFKKPVAVPIYSDFYCLFVLKTLQWFMRFITHLVLKYIYREWSKSTLSRVANFILRKGHHASVLVTHVLFNVFHSVLGLMFHLL